MRKKSPILETLQSLPDERGCYIIRVRGDRVLYVGRANSIRKRWLMGHNYRHLIESQFPEAVFETVLCDSNLSMIMTERRLIRELKPVLNRNMIGDVVREFGLNPNWWMYD